MSRFSGAALVQQTVTANDGGSVHDVTMKTEVRPMLPICFHLDIWGDDIEPNGFDSNMQPITQLEPGKRYIITVQARPEESEVVPETKSKTQKCIHIQSSLALYLQVKGTGVDQAISITNPQTTLIEDEANGYEYEFELETAAHLPYGKATLELLFKRGSRRSRPETAVTLPIFLAGNYNPIDQSSLDAVNVDLAMERPEQTAFIHVERLGEKIKLTCFGHSATGRINTIPFTPPKVRLADFIADEEKTSIVLGDVRAFSDDTANIKIEFEDVTRYQNDNPLTLLKWVHILFQRLGKDMQLVIYDHTDTEIPWEMLELEDGVYLGAIVSIARWLPIPLGALGHKKLEIRTESFTGHIVAYLDDQELSDTTVERNLLASFETEFHPSIDHLCARLKQSLSETGLVYLGCHGMFTPHDIDKIAYGSRNNPSNRLIPLQLENLDTQQAERPILFVNACHSGRVIRRQEEYRLHGLPIVMLKRIASGYIGTLGPVGSTYASEIARYILDAMHDKTNGAKPVQLLRQLRAMAAKQLNDDKDSLENQLRFIYTFMYVYYGNPLARLSLLPVQNVQGGGCDNE